MNLLDHPVTWEKREVVSNLELVDAVTRPAEDQQVSDMALKEDLFLLAAVNECIRQAEKEALSQLIEEFQDIFSKGEYDLGCTDLVTHDRNRRSWTVETAVEETPTATLADDPRTGHRDASTGLD